jgi:fructuronate reductase
VLAAWLCTLRGAGAAVTDPRADELVRLADGPLPDAARRVLGTLDPAVAEDDDVVSAVVAAAEELVTS